MDLKDKKILITGANGGLGRAMTAAMAERGARLALCEQTQELAEAAKAARLTTSLSALTAPRSWTG